MSERALFHMHDTYGALLRSLFTFANCIEMYEHMVDKEITRLLPAELGRLFGSPLYAKEKSDLLVSIGPSPSSRTTGKRKFVSPFVMEKI